MSAGQATTENTLEVAALDKDRLPLSEVTPQSDLKFTYLTPLERINLANHDRDPGTTTFTWEQAAKKLPKVV